MHNNKGKINPEPTLYLPTHSTPLQTQHSPTTESECPQYHEIRVWTRHQRKDATCCAITYLHQTGGKQFAPDWLGQCVEITAHCQSSLLQMEVISHGAHLAQFGEDRVLTEEFHASIFGNKTDHIRSNESPASHSTQVTSQPFRYLLSLTKRRYHWITFHL